MTALARIEKAGAQTTIQDGGRRGVRHFGMPGGGAADRLSLAIANVALGNPWDASALECALAGPTLRFEHESRFAFAGAAMEATLNDRPVERFTPHTAARGDILSLSAARRGLRAYLAFEGGIDADLFMASASTCAPAGVGGFKGRALNAGDILLQGAKEPREAAALPDALRPPIGRSYVLRAVRGPEWPLFDDRSRAFLFANSFEAGQRVDRMGAELTGAPIRPPTDFSMISSAVFPGVIQCPPSGAPFLLLADAQTTGGYARIAQIADADLHLAGQIRPGDTIWLAPLDADEAIALSRQKTALYAPWLPGFSFS